MIPWRGALAGLASIALAISVGWARVLHANLDAAQAHVGRLEAQTERDRDTIDQHQARAAQLADLLARERVAQARALTLQRELRHGLDQRQRQLERLTHENAALRHWADQPLPDPARRLRERPALTGADAYRQWLSGSGAVPAAGDAPPPQR